MPNESRVISFSNAEAIDALVDYCSTNKRELPKGGIKRLLFSNDSEIRSRRSSTMERPQLASTRTRLLLR